MRIFWPFCQTPSCTRHPAPQPQIGSYPAIGRARPEFGDPHHPWVRQTGDQRLENLGMPRPCLCRDHHPSDAFRSDHIPRCCWRMRSGSGRQDRSCWRTGTISRRHQSPDRAFASVWASTPWLGIDHQQRAFTSGQASGKTSLGKSPHGPACPFRSGD